MYSRKMIRNSIFFFFLHNCINQILFSPRTEFEPGTSAGRCFAIKVVDRADLRIGDARCVTRADQDAYRRDAVNLTVKLASRLSYERVRTYTVLRNTQNKRDARERRTCGGWSRSYSISVLPENGAASERSSSEGASCFASRVDAGFPPATSNHILYDSHPKQE